MKDKNTNPDFREHAKNLAETAVSLIAHIVEKHDATILEEMYFQLKKRDAEIEKLKSAIGKLTAWSVRELGQSAVNEILADLTRGD